MMYFLNNFRMITNENVPKLQVRNVKMYFLKNFRMTTNENVPKLQVRNVFILIYTQFSIQMIK